MLLKYMELKNGLLIIENSFFHKLVSELPDKVGIKTPKSSNKKMIILLFFEKK